MAFGCGPSNSEQQLEASQASLAQILQQDYSTRFAQQSAALDALNTSLSPIVAAGVNQQGFNPAELAARTTNAINTTAGNFRSAKQEAQTTLAGQGGGGTSGLASGVDKQIQGSIASEAAGQLSQEENQIAQENYATGRQNFFAAESGQRALAGMYDPTAFGAEASKTGESAFSMADTIQQQESQKWADIGNMVGVGASVLSGGLAGAKTGSDGSGGGFGGFMTGALGAA